MSDYSSLRVTRKNQEALNAVASRMGVSADRALGVALAALDEQEWRRSAARHADEMAADAADRAEVAAAAADLAGDDEG
ncbi:hypothetical protein KIH74_10660 [Kineosporia sp. J2-2]|uniref:Uncharacterized protein n=1 Tax=Kineosporia corallincola TaxID=2835133 RepID=A0ABS5TE86_9ACTN|nr:hypothetical protein [Kineosporia corallincola]MBT0769382.1 hypothetical protein [Kineosporia corallincola]